MDKLTQIKKNKLVHEFCKMLDTNVKDNLNIGRKGK